MGQYHKIVNLDRREYVHPHKLACGLKLWEQIAAHPSTATALVILLACSNARGGGDFDVDTNWHGPERIDFSEPGPMPKDYPSIARQTIGRWAGDRIAMIGDYAEDGDLPQFMYAQAETGETRQICTWPIDPSNKRPIKPSLIYSLCSDDWETEPHGTIIDLENGKAGDFHGLTSWTDVSDMVCAVIEHELGGKFVGEGWRDFKHEKDKATA